MVRLPGGARAWHWLSVGRAGVARGAVVRAAAGLAVALLLPAQPPRLGAVGRPGPPTRRLVADLCQEGGQLALALLCGALVDEAREVGCGRLQGCILVESSRDGSAIRLFVLQAGLVRAVREEAVEVGLREDVALLPLLLACALVPATAQVCRPAASGFSTPSAGRARFEVTSALRISTQALATTNYPEW